MKHFKKRTLALVLASVVTVVGSFAASNYKNSLTSLNFNLNSSGEINMTVGTKSPYSGNLTPIRRDSETYVLTLPEVKGEAEIPSLENAGGNIKSVDIRTMPYSNNAKGYTRITIKTQVPNLKLAVKNEIRLTSTKSQNSLETRNSDIDSMRQLERKRQERERLIQEQRNIAAQKVVKQDIPQNNVKPVSNPTQKPKTKSESTKPKKSDAITMSTNFNEDVDITENEHLYLILGILLVICCICYFYVKAKNKLQEIAGESFQIDLEDEKPKKEEKSKRESIRKTIKKLDSTYPKPTGKLKSYEYNSNKVSNISNDTPSIEELNIVDLDELFRQKQQNKTTSAPEEYNEEEDNDALEAFLSGFSFDEEEELLKEELENAPAYDEEFLDEVLNSLDFKFSKTDIECINELLNSEINNDTLNNISTYLVSNPIKAEPNKQKILEDLVTSYTISQNVVFKNDDIDILKKLINVELDPDFITDLRTNPNRTKQMEEDMKKFHSESKKPAETKILQVKDLLPNLSEELKNSDNRNIKSDYKSKIIDYHDNCEVTKLSVDTPLPDLTIAINDKNSYVSKPSMEYDLVADGYEVSTLSIDLDLPDLNDVLEHPEKYETKPKEEFIPDENALLNNLNDLTFKPFYDGTQTFEIINTEEQDDTPIPDAPSITEIQNEFKQFANFEVSEDEPAAPYSDLDNNDFEALFNNEFIDLDSEENILEKEPEIPPKTEEINIQKEVQTKTPIKKVEPQIVQNVKPAQKTPPKEPVNKPVLSNEQKPSLETGAKTPAKKEIDIKKLINRKTNLQNIDNKRAPFVTKDRITAEFLRKQNQIEESSETIKCIIDNETYNVLSTTKFDENKGCHLAKKQVGYAVLAYCRDKITKIKYYSEVKSEKIHSRLSETLEDGTLRYLIRIGMSKFIVDVSETDIKYVMELC